MQGRFGSLNVHRADCDRNHPNPCDPWEDRLPRLLRFLRTDMRCSVYAFQECLPRQADDITQGLGWATAKNPAWWGDENFNVVAVDRKKFTDVEVREFSLWRDLGDAGDVHRRSVIWLRLIHLKSGVQAWYGGSHLESGDGPARVIQGQRLVDVWPVNAGGPATAMLGIDRNSFTMSADGPRAVLGRAGIAEANIENPTSERSFNGFADPEPNRDGRSIDGIHYTGAVQAIKAQLHSTVGLRATDHSGLTLDYAIPEV